MCMPSSLEIIGGVILILYESLNNPCCFSIMACCKIKKLCKGIVEGVADFVNSSWLK